MADQRPPSFFHILMNPSSPHLPLPPKFVTKHLGDKILKDPLIKSANGGYLWKLKMKKIDDHSDCLVDGWCNVVKDVGLLFGEFLLFRYVGSSVFLMHVYSVNGCEKILVPKIKVVDYGFIDDDDNDGDDEVEEEDDVVYDVDDDNDDDHHRHVEDEDDDMEEVEDEDDDMEEVEDEDDVEFVDDGDEDDGMEEDDDVSYDVDDDDEDDIEFVYDGDEDDDVDVDGDDGDPFFILTSSKSNKNKLRMPADFVRSAGIDTKRTLTLRGLDGFEMAIPVQFDTQYGCLAKRYFLLKGWKDFMQGTNISEGDKCVFKFITSEDKLCLAKLTKPPPAAEAPATEVNGDDDKDENENENEDVEPVDDVDPFFVATITTSQKFRLYLPIDFVGLSRIDSKENIIMISLDGSESQMAVRKDKRRPSIYYHLSVGWHAFMRSNNITQGDKCVFKYITSEDKICLAKIIKALATEVDVEDVNPSFVVTITTMHTTRLPLPPDFIALARIDTKESIIMKNLDGNESQMAVLAATTRLDKQFNSTQYNLSLGWVAFKQSNNISQGDECVFKYITSEDKMCLVKITKASATEVNDGMDVEDDEDENVKLVDDADPFFAVTIIPSQRSVLPLPKDFVALARIGTKKNIIIKSLDGNETQMTLQSYKLKWSTRYCFSVGWTAFKRSNNISDGDECVLKYIKSEDKMCLAKITKKTTRATLLPAEVDNDDMDDEDVNEEGKGEDAKLVEEDDYDYDGDYDGDPSFILNISKANQYKLRFSPDFVALARIDTRETITLKNDSGYEKEMPVQSDKKRESTSYYVAAGWKEFQKSNDILEGDKCVFKFVPSEDKICLAKITKKKTPSRSLPPAAEAPVTEVDADDDGMDDKDAEDGNDKYEDENVKLVDVVDPFFVATITTSENRRLVRF